MTKLVDQLMRLAGQHAQKVLVEYSHQYSSLDPVFAIYAKGHLSLVATPWQNDQQKNLALGLIRLKLKADNAKAYSFVSEAWMLTFDKSEVDELRRQGKSPLQPSQSERRIEVVSAIAVAKTEGGLDKRFKIWEIVRDPNGRIIRLRDDPRTAPSDQIDGAMASLLDD